MMENSVARQKLTMTMVTIGRIRKPIRTSSIDAGSDGRVGQNPQ